MRSNRRFGWGLLLALAVSLVLAAAGCAGDDDDDAGDDDVAEGDDDDDDGPVPCTGDTQVPFDPRAAYQILPWPTDLVTTADPSTRTGRRLVLIEPYPPIMYNVLSNVSFMREAANTADGFSTTSRLFVPVDGELDAGSLPGVDGSTAPGASVQLFNADPDSEAYGEPVPIDVLSRPQLRHLQITPSVPLAGATKYVAVLTGAVAGATGDPVCPSPMFEYMRAEAPDPSFPYFDELEPARAHYQDVFAFLESLPEPIDRADVVFAFDFTTTATTADMEAVSQYLMDRAEVDPPDAVEWTVYPKSGQIGIEVQGSFPSPNFRDESGVFACDAQTHDPVEQDTENLDFILLIPNPGDEALTQPFPVILSLHGINASKSLVYSLRPQLSQNGFAAVATDFVLHGSREDPDAVMNGLRFLDIGHPLVMRDNMRQTVADQLQTVRFLKTLSELDVYPYDPGSGTYGDGVPDLDTDRILVWGHSFGGIFAPIIMAVSPDLEMGVLSPPAGQWTDIAEYSYYSETIVGVLRLLLGPDFEFPESLRLLLDVTNVVLDPADNLNYVRHVVDDPLPIAGRTKYLLMQESIGDETLPNLSTEILAAVAGVPLVAPNVTDVPFLPTQPAPYQGSGLFQYDAYDHGFYFEDDAYGIAARHQADVYWRSFLEDGVPTIIDPWTE